MRVLELNDAGLRLSDAEQLIVESPGYAALDGRDLRVGEAARARLRVDPRRCHDRYWYQLDAALPTPMAHARSAADLAHAHLQSLGPALIAQPLLIAAPASFTPAQLGLLLGILQALGARVAGLIDAAVAAASEVETHAQVVHVDAQLHRFLFTVLGGEVELERLRTEEHKPGIASLQDRCLAVFAEAFVRQTRFDPSHSAATEQLLFDRLPAWLAQLDQSASHVLEIPVGGRVHRASLTADALAATLADRHRPLTDSLARIGQSAPTTVLLSARAAAIPGLARQLPAAIRLDAQAPARGALRHAAQFGAAGSELYWVTRLPRRALALESATARTTRPTHALLDTRARPLPRAGESSALASWLPGAPGVLRATADQLLLEHAESGAVRVNGKLPPPLQPLSPGDVLAAAGRELRLIEVVPG